MVTKTTANAAKANKKAIHPTGEGARNQETSKNGFAARWQMEQMWEKKKEIIN